MIKKVLKYISYIFISLIFIGYVAVIAINTLNKEPLFKMGNYYVMHVNSDSMSPTINTGDLIFVKSNTKQKYQQGDIVVFYWEEGTNYIPTIHMIEEIVYDSAGNFLYYRTKGINNPIMDDKILGSSDIIGEYEGCKVPFIGYIGIFSETELGYWLLVVLPMGIIFLISTYQLIVAIINLKNKEREY